MGASRSPFLSDAVATVIAMVARGSTQNRPYRYGRWYGAVAGVRLRRTVRLWAGTAASRLR